MFNFPPKDWFCCCPVHQPTQPLAAFIAVPFLQREHRALRFGRGQFCVDPFRGPEPISKANPRWLQQVPWRMNQWIILTSVIIRSNRGGKDGAGYSVSRRLTVMVDTGFRPSGNGDADNRPCKAPSRQVVPQVHVYDLAVVEQPLASSSSSSSHPSSATDDSSVHILKPSKTLSAARVAEGEPANLSPSLIPAPQPTISLISNDGTDTLSVDSLTLVPPVHPDSILAVSGILQAPAAETDVCAETGDGHLSHPSDGDEE
ncbi:hypothetical protein JD844_020111 [Phrynosoma platyrhinos]|uniref:CLEC16A/TT9 C-terminal domain-containing protein n=1 Tax=Phrynosoma platyrhinos TaxID=52577 RepID=A0ABQ7TRL0_PHRPL|nr:hypothetical protein JD844_020111 [Phrynosoma platyrhinos]